MRLQQAEWPRIAQALGDHGWATTRPLLTADECADLIALYPEEHRFRSRVDMARFRFGEGEYKYFASPLPELVEQMRVHAYPPLAAVANRWQAALSCVLRRLLRFFVRRQHDVRTHG